MRDTFTRTNHGQRLVCTCCRHSLQLRTSHLPRSFDLVISPAPWGTDLPVITTGSLSCLYQLGNLTDTLGKEQSNASKQKNRIKFYKQKFRYQSLIKNKKKSKKQTMKIPKPYRQKKKAYQSKTKKFAVFHIEAGSVSFQWRVAQVWHRLQKQCSEDNFIFFHHCSHHMLCTASCDSWLQDAHSQLQLGFPQQVMFAPLSSVLPKIRVVANTQQ